MKKLMAILLLAAASITTPAFGFFGWFGCCNNNNSGYSTVESSPVITELGAVEDAGNVEYVEGEVYY